MNCEITGQKFKKFQDFLQQRLDTGVPSHLQKVYSKIVDKTNGWKYLQTLDIDVAKDVFSSTDIKRIVPFDLGRDQLKFGTDFFAKLKDLQKCELKFDAYAAKRNVVESDGYKFDADCELIVLYTKDGEERYLEKGKLIPKQKIYKVGNKFYADQCKLISLYADDNQEFLMEKGKLMKRSGFFRTAFQTRLGEEETNFVFEYDSNILKLLETVIYDKHALENYKFVDKISTGYENFMNFTDFSKFIDFLDINYDAEQLEEIFGVSHRECCSCPENKEE